MQANYKRGTNAEQTRNNSFVEEFEKRDLDNRSRIKPNPSPLKAKET